MLVYGCFGGVYGSKLAVEILDKFVEAAARSNLFLIEFNTAPAHLKSLLLHAARPAAGECQIGVELLKGSEVHLVPFKGVQRQRKMLHRLAVLLVPQSVVGVGGLGIGDHKF